MSTATFLSAKPSQTAAKFRGLLLIRMGQLRRRGCWASTDRRQSAFLSRLTELKLVLIICMMGASTLIGPTSQLFAQKQQSTLASDWKGEYLDERTGAFYTTLRLAPKLGGSLTSVTIELYNLLTKTTYIFSTPPGRSESYPVKLLKLPAGKYLVKSIQLVDLQANQRSWHISKDRSTQRSIIVQKQRLSNAGLWSIRPQGNKQLAVKFEMIEPSYAEDQAPADSSLEAVINGFNGLIQKRIGGSMVRNKAAKGYSDASTLRQAVTFTRQIAMFYTLDLFQHNYFARSASNIINTYDPSLRTCYTDLLERDPTQKGRIKFTFILSKETGTMIKLRASEATIKDPKMIECIYHQLGQMQFPAPQSMVGQIKFDFSVP